MSIYSEPIIFGSKPLNIELISSTNNGVITVSTDVEYSEILNARNKKKVINIELQISSNPVKKRSFKITKIDETAHKVSISSVEAGTEMSAELESTVNGMSGLLLYLTLIPATSQITLLSTGWTGNVSPYTYTIAFPGVIGDRTLVDIQFTDSVMNQLADDGITSIQAEAYDGGFTIEATGAKPTSNINIYYTLEGLALDIGTGLLVGGSIVYANPSLIGGESILNSISINGVSYAIPNIPMYIINSVGVNPDKVTNRETILNNLAAIEAIQEKNQNGDTNYLAFINVSGRLYPAQIINSYTVSAFNYYNNVATTHVIMGTTVDNYGEIINEITTSYLSELDDSTVPTCKAVADWVNDNIVPNINESIEEVKPIRHSVTYLSGSWQNSGNWYFNSAFLSDLEDGDNVSIEFDTSTIDTIISAGIDGVVIENISGSAVLKFHGAAPSTDITVQVTITKTVNGDSIGE